MFYRKGRESQSCRTEKQSCGRQGW
jgi:hypothetical protein